MEDVGVNLSAGELLDDCGVLMDVNVDDLGVVCCGGSRTAALCSIARRVVPITANNA